MEWFGQRENNNNNNESCQPLWYDEPVVVVPDLIVAHSWIYPFGVFFFFFSQKSKEEKKKKKHKHEEKGEDLLGVQADELVVQSEETSEVAAVPTSTSAEVHP